MAEPESATFDGPELDAPEADQQVKVKLYNRDEIPSLERVLDVSR